jgi:hypothetical protein
VFESGIRGGSPGHADFRIEEGRPTMLKTNPERAARYATIYVAGEINSSGPTSDSVSPWAATRRLTFEPVVAPELIANPL